MRFGVELTLQVGKQDPYFPDPESPFPRKSTNLGLAFFVDITNATSLIALGQMVVSKLPQREVAS